LAKPPRYDGVTADLPLYRAAGIVIGALNAEFAALAPDVLRGDDVRAVHDLRVNLRRLRSALAAFAECFPVGKRDRYRRELRRLARSLGVVRDTDVQLAALRTALGAAAVGEASGVAYAIDNLVAKRRRALAEFAIELSQFDREGFARLAPIVRKRGPRVWSAAPRMIEARRARFARKLDAALQRRHFGRMHRARIAGKRLRYTIEFFRSAFGISTSEVLQQLALVQERLGTVADADASLRLYADFEASLAVDDPRREGLRARIAAARRERTRALAAVRALWRGSARRARYPEMLAASISDALGSLSPNDAA
jgi:CHAD domain-containing protein